MAEENVFNKIHVDESDKADLGGVLEQLNIPPTAVQYIRKNQKTINIILSIVTVCVVTWALYDSYVEKRTSKSSSALAVAQNLTGDEKIKSLQQVIDSYANTDAALWAKIDLARYHVDKKEYALALENYSAVRADVSPSNPLYPLVVYGLAQAEEEANNLDNAIKEYEILKTVKGYESLGYTGLARIYEVQGKVEDSVNELVQYQTELITDNPNSPEANKVAEKISRLKASM